MATGVTGKSTAVRALAALLPRMRAIVGCRYGCDPASASASCENCAALKANGKTPPKSHLVPVPVVDLPLGATEDRVVGALDLERALSQRIKAFEPMLFSWRAADPAVLQKLIDGTGSTLDATGLALYGKLICNPGHAAGASAMMANWDLPQLVRDLPQLTTPLCLAVGSNRTIAPQQASRVLAMLPPAAQSSRSARSSLVTLAGLGHLAHKKRPDWVAAVVLAQFRGISCPKQPKHRIFL